MWAGTSSARSSDLLATVGRLVRTAMPWGCVAAAALCSVSAARADIPEREPRPDAPPHEVFRATSKGGLRYAWWLPPGYDAKKPRSLTVILHGTGLDYRWGPANHKPQVFRPKDVVVSVDGTSPGPNDSRLFLGKPEDASVFREFLAEMRRLFAVERVFLYGHSQGGFFVVYFAGEHPGEAAGVVAHNSGAWNWTKEPPELKKVAIAFQHGTADPVVPYRQSAGSRDHYTKKGFDLVRLRRLERYNHWPNAVRSTETLGWCERRTTPRPEEALELAAELLRPKGIDEYQWRTAVDHSGARAILRRFEGKGANPFKSPKPALTSRAKQLIGLIEGEGKAHAAAISQALKRSKGLVLDGGPWIGHLAAVREDFRGVAAVESFARQIKLDEALALHEKAAGKILNAWYGSAEPKQKFQAVVSGIKDSFLFEGFPPNLWDEMTAWKNSAAGLGIAPAALADFRHLEAWKKGWDEGLKAYAKLWMAWKGL